MGAPDSTARTPPSPATPRGHTEPRGGGRVERGDSRGGRTRGRVTPGLRAPAPKGPETPYMYPPRISHTLQHICALRFAKYATEEVSSHPQTSGGDALPPPQTHTHIHTLRKRPTDPCVSMFHLPPGPAVRLMYPPRSIGSLPDCGAGGGRAAPKEAVAAAAQVLRSRPQLRSPAAPGGRQGRGWAGRRLMERGIPSDPKGMVLRVFLWCPN